MSAAIHRWFPLVASIAWLIDSVRVPGPDHGTVMSGIWLATWWIVTAPPRGVR